MSYIKASEVVIGQRIVLDIGYGHPMEETCVVTAIEHATNLFGFPVFRLKVRRPSGDTIDVADLSPDDNVDIPKEHHEYL